MQDFAATQAKAHGIDATAHITLRGDFHLTVGRDVIAAAAETGCDLIVTASHAPMSVYVIRQDTQGIEACQSPATAICYPWQQEVGGMITLDDVEDMSDLTRDEIDALAEHEHLTVFDAVLLGEYLMHVHHGPQKVHQMICEDIRAALHADNVPHARELFAVLRGFLADHPEAARGVS